MPRPLARSALTPLTGAVFSEQSGALLAAVGGLSHLSPAATASEDRKVRVAAVFLAQIRNSWPYPGFDAAGRQNEILAALREGCPDVEFLPVTIHTPGILPRH